MAFSLGFDFSSVLVKFGVSEGKKRRAQQKSDKREGRSRDSASTLASEERQASSRKRSSLIRTQFGATTGRVGKLGEPNTGRRRLTT